MDLGYWKLCGIKLGESCLISIALKGKKQAKERGIWDSSMNFRTFLSRKLSC